MAVEIIDEGPDPSVLKEVICRKCGAKLRFAPIDVLSKDYREIDGASDTMYWIDCPKCKYMILLSRPDA